MPSELVSAPVPFGFPWQTADPFLFCVHHVDAYPHGNARLGPEASLVGRNLGMDFEGIDGWRMYHGRTVPGFPQHPHRGFETITVARRGYIDHSDSLGAKARFGKGDVQWMTAGSGIVHSEMFPLLEQGQDNPVELFQIWLNLPQQDKMVAPYFTMMWSDTIPHRVTTDAQGRKTEICIVAGGIEDMTAPTPPPNSWAARTEAQVAVWTIALEPGARWKLPNAAADVNRVLYYFDGQSIDIGDRHLTAHGLVVVRADGDVVLQNGEQASELLLLQGRPIGEPVAQHGPFVMNSAEEIRQAIRDYQRTQFGGWPWPSDDPVHDRSEGRFAIHADGRRESAPSASTPDE